MPYSSSCMWHLPMGSLSRTNCLTLQVVTQLCRHWTRIALNLCTPPRQQFWPLPQSLNHCMQDIWRRHLPWWLDSLRGRNTLLWTNRPRTHIRLHQAKKHENYNSELQSQTNHRIIQGVKVTIPFFRKRESITGNTSPLRPHPQRRARSRHRQTEVLGGTLERGAGGSDTYTDNGWYQWLSDVYPADSARRCNKERIISKNSCSAECQS